MYPSSRSDRSLGEPVRRSGGICGNPKRRDRESGVAVVEFVLVLFPLIIFVGGIIQLGIGIADWHNLNRIANEGARWAAINDWPDCTEAPDVCAGDNTCDDTFVNFLRCEAVDAGMPASAVQITVCQPAGAVQDVGEPVTVRLTSRVKFLSGSKNDRRKADWLGFNIRGQATMRLETRPTNLGLGAAC